MTTVQEETPASTREKTYTKEELDKLRRRLAGATFGNDTEPPSGNPGGEPSDWSSDRDLMIKFLQDLRRILGFLIEERIPNPPQARYQFVLEQLDPTIEDAIAELRSIDSVTHSLYKALERLGLAGESWLAKADEFRDSITGRPVLAVLDIGDKILGSLCKVLTQLEPFKEMKELVEHRMKYGGDSGLISLNL